MLRWIWHSADSDLGSQTPASTPDVSPQRENQFADADRETHSHFARTRVQITRKRELFTRTRYARMCIFYPYRRAGVCGRWVMTIPRHVPKIPPLSPPIAPAFDGTTQPRVSVAWPAPLGPLLNEEKEASEVYAFRRRCVASVRSTDPFSVDPARATSRRERRTASGHPAGLCTNCAGRVTNPPQAPPKTRSKGPRNSEKDPIAGKVDSCRSVGRRSTNSESLF